MLVPVEVMRTVNMLHTCVTIVTIVRISNMTLNVNTQIDYKSIICKWWEIRTQHTHS